MKPTSGTGATSDTTLISALGAFAADVQFDALPAEVVSQLKACLVFNLGVARAGRPLVADLADRYVQSGGVADDAAVWFGDRRGGAEHVAFANAMAVHARAQDDFQHKAHTHVGAVTLPAGLATGEQHDVTGADFLAALAVGYQVTSVLGSVSAWVTTPRGIRATPTYGPMGAAAACAKLAGGTQEQIATAIGLAAHSGFGMNHAWAEGTHEWRIHVGTASQSAVRCAQLAMLGADVGPATLEGNFGFYRVLTGERVDTRRVLSALRSRWEISDIRFKPKPVCGINQGPVVNALALAAERRFAIRDVAKIRVEMRPEDAAYPGVNSNGPFHGSGSALMSTPYVVSTCLVEEALAFEHIANPRRPETLDLVGRVEIIPRDDLDELSHVLTVVAHDGTEHVRKYVHDSATSHFERNSVREILSQISSEVDDPAVASEEREQAIDALDQSPDLHALLDSLK